MGDNPRTGPVPLHPPISFQPHPPEHDGSTSPAEGLLCPASPSTFWGRDRHLDRFSERDERHMSTAEGLGLENIRSFVGKEVGVSAWEAVDQQRINGFADTSGDHQWIHVDPDRARRESPYGATVAHGYLMLSLLGPATLDVLIRPAGIPAALNYGIDRARFIAPVKAGSRVRNRIRLVAVEDKGHGRTLLTTENTLEIEGEDKPALIAQVLTMAVR